MQTVKIVGNVLLGSTKRFQRLLQLHPIPSFRNNGKGISNAFSQNDSNNWLFLFIYLFIGCKEFTKAS